MLYLKTIFTFHHQSKVMSYRQSVSDENNNMYSILGEEGGGGARGKGGGRGGHMNSLQLEFSLENSSLNLMCVQIVDWGI